MQGLPIVGFNPEAQPFTDRSGLLEGGPRKGDGELLTAAWGEQVA